ncbi:hypothetical protein AGLY_011103 [Aphis glycines]|uniref:Uncharacterized protein n=1 Tax=Aphis glycines TaxID=307491 RepID=A0A6G0TEM4_APHGL|nr:hypothetical protein AGLY_011103 [Aphis glycines]
MASRSARTASASRTNSTALAAMLNRWNASANRPCPYSWLPASLCRAAAVSFSLSSSRQLVRDALSTYDRNTRPETRPSPPSPTQKSRYSPGRISSTTACRPLSTVQSASPTLMCALIGRLSSRNCSNRPQLMFIVLGGIRSFVSTTWHTSPVSGRNTEDGRGKSLSTTGRWSITSQTGILFISAADCTVRPMMTSQDAGSESIQDFHSVPAKPSARLIYVSIT